MRSFFRGFSYPFKGLDFAFAHADIRRLLWGPVLLGIALLTGEWLGLRLTIHHYLPDAGFFKLALAWVAGLLAIVFSFLALQGVLCAPFCDTISKRTEAHALGKPPPKASLPGQLVSLGHALVRAVCYLALLALFFIVGLFVPLMWIASWLLSAIYAALDALDYPETRRGWSFGRKLSYLGQHKGAALGFGAAAALIAAIPILGLLCAPASAVGGTLLFLDLERAFTSPAQPGNHTGHEKSSF
jgi:CysZ protein